MAEPTSEYPDHATPKNVPGKGRRVKLLSVLQLHALSNGTTLLLALLVDKLALNGGSRIIL